MSSPATVTIDNRSSYTIVTHVTRNYWVEGDGDSIDGKTIEADSKQTYTVKAKTAHHGELTSTSSIARPPLSSRRSTSTASRTRRTAAAWPARRKRPLCR
ncbi:hypothetical protein LMG31886_11130 [Xanthomonas hydrangeae]|nr:hypothetical protein LMG31884_12150 [Xanthomonas hydrangeae]CAD7714621.1 hypothetical protein LMG31884_12150 [Xanthomonas hydrangeae]CAD7722269.1 hypothetical protein LMG31885_04360 [Xanthomonas hydrangeae]CAD7722273.1 hypothetical protein LMG31885_04360 [Xanthomonas hydrangeae]CAD7724519.1 hypothetical protein LMG31887_12160 [Xanthomonas hydrangeae]